MADSIINTSLSVAARLAIWSNNFVLLARHLTKRGNLLESFRQRAVVSRLLQQPSVEASLAFIPIKRLKKSEQTPKTFCDIIRHKLQPVVLEGFADESIAVRDWTPEFFNQHYGNEKVLIRHIDELGGTTHHMPGTLSEVLEGILAGQANRMYVDNVADIFIENPELELSLPIKQLSKLTRGHLFGSQLFLGGKETGSLFHCANGHNFFVMIHGEKEWIFADPNYTAWMEPKLHRDAIYLYSDLDHNKSVAELEEQFPLYNRIVKYRTVLKPGDVLFNPSWWWHAITNKTPSSIGVATRWPKLSAGIKSNAFASFLQALTPHQWKVIKSYWRGQRLTDINNKARFENTGRKNS